MLRIANEDIYINAGDTAAFAVDILDENDEEYILNSRQRLSLWVGRDGRKEFEIFSGYGETGFLITPEHTEKLFGKYGCVIKLQHEDGSVYTIIGESPTAKAHFYVMEG